MSKLWFCLGEAAVSHEDEHIAEQAHRAQEDAFVQALEVSVKFCPNADIFYLLSCFVVSQLFVPEIISSRCCFDYFCILMGQEIAIGFLNRSINLYFIFF